MGGLTAQIVRFGKGEGVPKVELLALNRTLAGKSRAICGLCVTVTLR
jgi:hypothetical protein